MDYGSRSRRLYANEARDFKRRSMPIAPRRETPTTAPGGIGKTAVALVIAQRLASTFRDGVRLVDLGSLAT